MKKLILFAFNWISEYSCHSRHRQRRCYDAIDEIFNSHISRFETFHWCHLLILNWDTTSCVHYFIKLQSELRVNPNSKCQRLKSVQVSFHKMSLFIVWIRGLVRVHAKIVLCIHEYYIIGNLEKWVLFHLIFTSLFFNMIQLFRCHLENMSSFCMETCECSRIN